MITLGISFCPNDTFSFAHLLQENEFDWKLADLETLNEQAIDKQLDVVKVSAALYPQIEQEYQILQSGSALGFNIGPKVIAKENVKLESATCALPGKYTTVSFLFDLFFPQVTKKIFVRYDEIMPLIRRDSAHMGVIIHESRFTFQKEKLIEIADLGKLWELEFALPLPLGIVVAKRSLGEEKIIQIENRLTSSIARAKLEPEKVWEFVKANSTEKKDDVIQSHIDLYVNEETSRLSTLGKKALHTLWESISCKI